MSLWYTDLPPVNIHSSQPQIVSAMSYAHANGIVHRDIKPSNVMLSGDISESQAKLLDFGVARFATQDLSLTRTGAIVGSPFYLSPEQAIGEDATPHSDVYSFGCLMFETLTGELPFRGATALETISMHRNEAPPLLTDLISVQMLPRELVKLVDECLREDPLARPQEFTDVAERLKFIQEKLENKRLTPELKQRISSQHIKIRLMQFWKSKFGFVVIFASVIIFAGLGVSIFNSEQKRISESTSIPKHSPIENPLVQSNLSIKDGAGFDYSHTKTGLIVSSDNSVTDANLKHLSSMHMLKTLRIVSPVITDEGLKQLSQIHSLECLHLFSDKITAHGVGYLESLPRLEELALRSSAITDDIVKPLKKMKKLREIYIKDSSVSEDIGIKLAALKTIEKLDLSGTKNISDKSFESLCSLKLKVLNLDDITFSASSFRSISEMKSLQTLMLGTSRFSPSDLSSLQELPILTRMDFSCRQEISDEMINKLVQIQQLDTLIFNDSKITDSQV